MKKPLTGLEETVDETVVEFEAFLKRMEERQPKSCALELCTCAKRRTLRELANNLVAVQVLYFPEEGEFMLSLIEVLDGAEDPLLALEDWAIEMLTVNEDVVRLFRHIGG